MWCYRFDLLRGAETGAWQQFAKPLRHERLDPGVDGLPVALVLHGDAINRRRAA